jgi:hypothetical protein
MRLHPSAADPDTYLSACKVLMPFFASQSSFLVAQHFYSLPQLHAPLARAEGKRHRFRVVGMPSIHIDGKEEEQTNIVLMNPDMTALESLERITRIGCTACERTIYWSASRWLARQIVGGLWIVTNLAAENRYNES